MFLCMCYYNTNLVHMLMLTKDLDFVHKFNLTGNHKITTDHYLTKARLS